MPDPEKSNMTSRNARALEKLGKLIDEIDDEDAPDHLQYCWVILTELKEIRKILAGG